MFGVSLFSLSFFSDNANNAHKIGTTDSGNDNFDKSSANEIDLYNGVDSQKHDQISKTVTDQTECLSDCKNALLDTLLSENNLSPEDINLITSNLEYYIRYLRYNSDLVARFGAFLSTANVGDEGSDDYNEDLDRKVMLLDDLLSQLPLNDLKRAANSKINSHDGTSRLAGLKIIEAAYLTLDDSKEDDVDSLQKKAELGAILNNFLYSETDPKHQLSAIKVLSMNNPDMITPQVTDILSGLSRNDPDPDIRGHAIELAAISAQPNSLVLTQIADELAQPSSPLHASALKALETVHSRTSKDDTIMLKRLEEFEVYLQNFVFNTGISSETSDYATDLIETYYKD